MSNEIKITEVEIIRVQPGDIVVFKAEEIISDRSRAEIMENLVKLFPGNQCIILDNNSDITMLRK